MKAGDLGGFIQKQSNLSHSGNCWVHGNVCVLDTVTIGGKVSVFENIQLHGNAVIKSIKDYLIFKNWWSSGRTAVWTRSNNLWQAGCFIGSGEELVAKAYNDSEISGREYERIVKYVESILKGE